MTGFEIQEKHDELIECYLKLVDQHIKLSEKYNELVDRYRGQSYELINYIDADIFRSKSKITKQVKEK